MECLQGVQYFVIDECDNPVNKLLTVAGYLHICFQPFAVHWLKDFNNPEMQARSEGIRRICFLGGVVLFAKFLMYPWSTDEGIACLRANAKPIRLRSLRQASSRPDALGEARGNGCVGPASKEFARTEA